MSGFPNSSQFSVKAALTNVSLVPAFNFNIYWEDKSKDSKKDTIFPSGQTISMCFTFTSHPYTRPYSFEEFYIVKYESPIGISVRDRFHITGTIGNGGILRGGKLIERKFRRSSSISIEIEDDI